MNANELRDKTPDQVRDELVALKKEAFNLRFQRATGQMENTSRMRQVRRGVARVNTILNQKAAAAAGEEYALCPNESCPASLHRTKTNRL